MARFESLDLNALSKALQQARMESKTRSNPRGSKVPAGVKRIYDIIGRSGDFLLGSNSKVEKGEKFKYATDILHFASSDTARKVVSNDPAAFGYTAEEAAKIKNICPHASPGCIDTCLVGSGHGGLGGDVAQFKINDATNARIRRQLLMERNGEAFFTALVIEIAKHFRKYTKEGYTYCVRLNGTSDIDWENIPVRISSELANWIWKSYKVQITPGLRKNIFVVFPRIQFYDYTKVEPRWMKYAAGKLPSNYYLTWSLSEVSKNRFRALEILLNKEGAVAVPFNTPPSTGKKAFKHIRPLPETLGFAVSGKVFKFKVFDADEDDLRFLDPKRGRLGQIAGLRFKMPTDKSKRAAIESTDFLLKSWPQKHPVIRMTGNVI